MSELWIDLAGWAFKRTVEWINKEDDHTLPLPASAWYRSDDHGRQVKVTFAQPLPADTVLVIQVLSLHGPLRAVKEYRLSSEYFVRVTKIANGEPWFYVPFAALQYAAAGEYTLYLYAWSEEAKRQWDTRFKFDLPAPRRWSRVEHAGPLIDLCMLMARSEGNLAKKVHIVRRGLHGLFDFTEAELGELRMRMKRGHSMDAAELTREVLLRELPVDGEKLLGLLAEIASGDKYVSPGELVVFRETATALGHDHAATESIIQRFGLTAVDYWALLEVKPGVSREQLQSAFRSKMKMYHPDRVSQLPEEFRQLATRMTIDLKQAYETLLAIS